MNVNNENDKLDDFLEYFMFDKKYDRDTVLGLSLLCDKDEQMVELLDYVKERPDIDVDEVSEKALEIHFRDKEES